MTPLEFILAILAIPLDPTAHIGARILVAGAFWGAPLMACVCFTLAWRENHRFSARTRWLAANPELWGTSQDPAFKADEPRALIEAYRDTRKGSA